MLHIVGTVMSTHTIQAATLNYKDASTMSIVFVPNILGLLESFTALSLPF